MENTNNLTPSPTTSPVVSNTLTFPQALNEVIQGKFITRKSWNDMNEYAGSINDWLTLRHEGKFSKWIVSAGDLEATDWVVIA